MCHRGDAEMSAGNGEDHSATGFQRGTGGYDIVYQQHVFSAQEICL